MQGRSEILQLTCSPDGSIYDSFCSNPSGCGTLCMHTNLHVAQNPVSQPQTNS